MDNMPVTPKPLEVSLKFSGDGVAAPAQRAAADSTELINFVLKSIAQADLSVPTPQNTGNRLAKYAFAPIERSASQRADFYRAWIVAKGFHELSRGLRATFEEAYLYIEGLRSLSGTMTWGEMTDKIKAIRRVANRKNFPDLIESVSNGLKSPLNFASEIASFQKVRNCLEHRAGIVSEEDVDADGKLVLFLPRLFTFLERDGQEIEVAVGTRVDAGEHVHIKTISYARSYDLGRTIKFDADEFGEIAFGCSLLASDLASKLPAATPQH